tara:strand:+ start:360 stop:704 length:345 start_codon:yes stop_codon:yes gene_type:complete
MELLMFKNHDIRIAMNLFSKDLEKYGWSLNSGSLGKTIMLSHDNFHYECESYDEVVKVMDMFDNLPLGNTREEWQENAKVKLTNIENAKKLLADFHKPITCKFEYNIKKLMARA